MGPPARPASWHLQQCHAVSGSILSGATEGGGGPGRQSDPQLYSLISNQSRASESRGTGPSQGPRTSDTPLMCQTAWTPTGHEPLAPMFFFSYTVESRTKWKSRWAKSVKRRDLVLQGFIYFNSYPRPLKTDIKYFWSVKLISTLSIKAYLIISLLNWWWEV